MIAVLSMGEVIPPSGRCQELMSQLFDKNMRINALVVENEVIKLKDYLKRVMRSSFQT